jgi:tetratricopeptide (TPR) repeat protein
VIISRLALVVAAAVALSGCRRREITPLQRDEAANMVSEADFAATIREWSRAEGLYAQAVELCPDVGDTWVSLGIARMRLGDHGGARQAFKSAASAYKDDSDANPTHSQSVLHRAYVLVLLGRADEARSSVDKAHEKFPEDRLLSEFIDNGTVDKLTADPALKDITP